MARTILQGRAEGTRRQGRQKKRLEDNIDNWIGHSFICCLKTSKLREVIYAKDNSARQSWRNQGRQTKRWEENIHNLISHSFTCCLKTSKLREVVSGAPSTDFRDWSEELSKKCVTNSIEPDLTHSASDLGLHYSLKPVCPNTLGTQALTSDAVYRMIYKAN